MRKSFDKWPIAAGCLGLAIMAGTSLSEPIAYDKVPEPVKTTFKTLFPNGTIAKLDVACKGGSAQVRRVDEGVYEVRFPQVSARLALVTATSDEGVTSSAIVFGSTVRVALRGPLHGPDLMERRDVPFVVVVY